MYWRGLLRCVKKEPNPQPPSLIGKGESPLLVGEGWGEVNPPLLVGEGWGEVNPPLLVGEGWGEVQ
jgi:hypothetical protein